MIGPKPVNIISGNHSGTGLFGKIPGSETDRITSVCRAGFSTV